MARKIVNNLHMQMINGIHVHHVIFFQGKLCFFPIPALQLDIPLQLDISHIRTLRIHMRNLPFLCAHKCGLYVTVYKRIYATFKILHIRGNSNGNPPPAFCTVMAKERSQSLKILRKNKQFFLERPVQGLC